MLKPNGQLFFVTFGKTPMDEVFDILDDGKWVKYNNRKAISQFSRYLNPLKEYEALMENFGYIDLFYDTEDYTGRFSEKMLEGKFLLDGYTKGDFQFKE